MPIQLSTNTLKTRESTSDSWEASAVIVQSDLDSLLAITGDGVLDPSFTATDLTGAANELNSSLTNLDAGGVGYDSTESYSSGTVGAELTSQKNTLNQLETNVGKILPVITGTTNNSGYTIAVGDYFEANGLLYKATASIPINGAWSSSATAQTSTAVNDLKNTIDDKFSTQGYSVPANSSITINSPNLPTAYLVIGTGMATDAICAAIGSGYGATEQRHKIQVLLASNSFTFTAKDDSYGLIITSHHPADRVFYVIKLI